MNLTPLLYPIGETFQSITDLIGIKKLEKHPDAEPLDNNILVIDTYNQYSTPSSSKGSTYLKVIKPIICMRQGLKEADPDAYNFFLRKEICAVKNSGYIVKTVATIVTTVALTLLLPTIMPIWATFVTAIVVNTIMQAVLKQLYEIHSENQAIATATPEELKGAKRFVEAMKANDVGGYNGLDKKLKIENWTDDAKKTAIQTLMAIKEPTAGDSFLYNEAKIRPSHNVMSTLPPDVKKYFEVREVHFKHQANTLKWIILTDLIAITSVIPAILSKSFIAMLAVPFATHLAVTELLAPLKEWQFKKDLVKLNEVVAENTTPAQREAAKKWLEEQTDPRLKNIII